MEMNYILGKLYDMIYYTVVFFNKERLREQIKMYGDDEEIFLFYNEMRKDKYHIDPPERLYTLFFYDASMPCVITEYFRKNFKYFTGTEQDFLDLFSDIKQFKKYVFCYYLEPYRKTVNIEKVIKGDAEEIGKALVELRRHGDIERNYL